MPAIKQLPEPLPYAPAEWEPPDIAAMQALQRGDATPDQQKRALDWVIMSVCGTYDLTYRTDPRADAFVSGRRFVGLQIIKALKVKLTALGVNKNTGVDPFKSEKSTTQ